MAVNLFIMQAFPEGGPELCSSWLSHGCPILSEGLWMEEKELSSNRTPSRNPCCKLNRFCKATQVNHGFSDLPQMAQDALSSLKPPCRP